MASSIEAIQKILQETIAPSVSRIEVELAGVKADIRSLQSEIRRLDDKIDNGLARLDSKIDNGLARLDSKIESLRNEMINGFARHDERMDHLEDKLTTALEIRERLAALEAKMSLH
jgi:predicted  nucleic acid-binding Zn-ribbon protein